MRAVIADVAVVAHRGSSGSAPENTIAAVELAVHEQASFVEVDVQRTGDGELVVVHDTTLARTTDVARVFPDRAPWRVGGFTRAELDRLDAGSWCGSEFLGEPIPTLSDVLDTVGGATGLMLELKAPKLYPGIEAQGVDELFGAERVADRSPAFRPSGGAAARRLWSCVPRPGGCARSTSAIASRTEGWSTRCTRSA